MLSVFELYKIVGAWCDEVFGTCNVESKTSGDGESMRSFYYHCLGDDPDSYVDIGARMNGAETCTSIWSHNTDNVHIQLFRDDSIRWNDEDTYYAEFCGEEEMKKLYEIIQHITITRNNEEICEAAVLSEEKVTKKHPLQDSPTFPEENSVECDVPHDDVKMNKPVISFDDVQNIITKWLDDNKIEFTACESEAGKFYYDLNDKRFIKGELITDPSCDNEQFIGIHASGESPYIKITSSDVYLTFPFKSRLKYNLLEGLYNAIQSHNSDANENVTDSDIEQLSELHREYLNALSKNKKPISVFKMVPIFNTEALETNAPYIIKNLENNTMGIVTLRDCSADYVVFGLWDDEGEYIVEEFTVTEFNGAFELYTTNGVKVEL